MHVLIYILRIQIIINYLRQSCKNVCSLVTAKNFLQHSLHIHLGFTPSYKMQHIVSTIMEKMNGFWTQEISLVLLLFEGKKRKNVLICRLNRKNISHILWKKSLHPQIAI